MTIFYLMIEAVPKQDNPESKEFGGAFINLWVKATTKNEALKKAKNYVDEVNWKFVNAEEISVAKRSTYIDKPDSLECYDEACEKGLSAIFYTWAIGEDV
ncbi:MAG: hypothetical protein E7490_06900 [Ruminococcaceae bacterium]|nr:hypothetical protein [Oscillospiraceae bacterium]